MREIEKERKRIEIEMGRLWGPLDWWPNGLVVKGLFGGPLIRKRRKTKLNKERKREKEMVKWVGEMRENEMGGREKSTQHEMGGVCCPRCQ